MDSPRTWRPQATAYKSGPYTTEAKGAPKVDGESVPRRTLTAKDSLIYLPTDGVETVYDILRHSAAKYGNAKALGSRKLLRTHEEVKKVKKTVDGKELTVDKKWTYYEMSEYHFMSFEEYEQMAIHCGAGLRKLGMQKDDRLHIFAATTPYWLAMAHGTKFADSEQPWADFFPRGHYTVNAHSDRVRYARGRRLTAFPLSNACQIHLS